MEIVQARLVREEPIQEAPNLCISKDDVYTESNTETQGALASMTHEELVCLIQDIVREELDALVDQGSIEGEPCNYTSQADNIVELPFMLVGSLFISLGLGIQGVGKSVSGAIPKQRTLPA